MAQLAVRGLLKMALAKTHSRSSPRFAPRRVTVTEQDVELAVARLNRSSVLRWVDNQTLNMRSRFFWISVLEAIGVTCHNEELGDDCAKKPQGKRAATDVRDTLCALIIALSSTGRPSPQDEVLFPFCMVVARVLCIKPADLQRAVLKVVGKVNGPDALRYAEIWLESPGDDDEQESQVVYWRDSISKVLQSAGYDADTVGPFVAIGETKDDVRTTVLISDLSMTIRDVMRQGHMSTLRNIVKGTKLQVESPSPNSANVLLTVHPEQNIWDVLKSAGYVGSGLGSQFIAQGQNEDGKPVGVVITKWHTTIRDVMRDGNMRALFSVIRAFRVPLEKAWTYS